MASAVQVQFLGDDLSEATLVSVQYACGESVHQLILSFNKTVYFHTQHLYLKDPAFVEYFNAFLLLPVSP